MFQLNHNDEDTVGTVFRDVILLALLGFVAIVVLVLPLLNPPAKAEKGIADPPGNVIVEIRWADELNADVDLWVQAPGDVPVGYSNKGGLIFNLLRDDLGHRGDATGLNYEVSYSRGIPEGEYAVNVHLYRNSDSTYPVEVKVVATIRSDASSSVTQLLETKVNLRHENEEITALRFTLNKSGELVAGTVHSLQKELRAFGSS